jgi:hypothetical protein
VPVVDGQVVGQPLPLGQSEHLAAGEVDDTLGGFGRQQHVPGAEDVDGHDLFRAAGGVVREGGQVNDRRAAAGRPAHGREVQQVIALDAVEADHVVAEPFQAGCDLGADEAAMPGDEDAHGIIVCCGPTRRQLISVGEFSLTAN